MAVFAVPTDATAARPSRRHCRAGAEPGGPRSVVAVFAVLTEATERVPPTVTGLRPRRNGRDRSASLQKTLPGRRRTWRATLCRGRLRGTNGRDRSASLQPSLGCGHVATDATAALPSISDTSASSHLSAQSRWRMIPDLEGHALSWPSAWRFRTRRSASLQAQFGCGRNPRCGTAGAAAQTPGAILIPQPALCQIPSVRAFRTAINAEFAKKKPGCRTVGRERTAALRLLPAPITLLAATTERQRYDPRFGCRFQCLRLKAITGRRTGAIYSGSWNAPGPAAVVKNSAWAARCGNACR